MDVFLLLKGKLVKYILPALGGLAILSCVAFLAVENEAAKFYFIQYRFFELAIGGVVAIYFREQIVAGIKGGMIWLWGALFLLLCLLGLPIFESNDWKIIGVVWLTSVVLVVGGIHFQSNPIYKFILSNKLLWYRLLNH